MWLMVITSEWKRGLFAYQHPFRCCAIWKIQLLHKFALFQIEYFTGAQQTWEYFKIFYNLPNILVFDFAFPFQITLQEIIALLNVSRLMQHLVKLHIKTLINITSIIIPPNCIFLVAELIFLNMWHLNWNFTIYLISYQKNAHLCEFPWKYKMYYGFFECLSIAFEGALKWFVLFAAF